MLAIVPATSNLTSHYCDSGTCTAAAILQVCVVLSVCCIGTYCQVFVPAGAL
jgi:hypothetical protein